MTDRLETLRQIYNASGGRRVRVRREDWKPGAYYLVVGISPEGYAVGWHSAGPIEILEGDKPLWQFVLEEEAPQ